MLGFFKNKKEKKSRIQFVDLDGNQLKVGDIVLSYRYDLGKCIIKTGENGFDYESIDTKKVVNWALMVDAATERQKVRKIQE